jgi:hypothetical protein
MDLNHFISHFGSTNKFILNENNQVVPTFDINEWMQFVNSSRRDIRKSTINNIGIITIFVGSSINSLFETKIFSLDNNKVVKRYSTYEDALAGHQMVCNLIENGATLADFAV